MLTGHQHRGRHASTVPLSGTGSPASPCRRRRSTSAPCSPARRHRRRSPSTNTDPSTGVTLTPPFAITGADAAGFSAGAPGDDLPGRRRQRRRSPCRSSRDARPEERDAAGHQRRRAVTAVTLTGLGTPARRSRSRSLAGRHRRHARTRRPSPRAADEPVYLHSASGDRPAACSSQPAACFRARRPRPACSRSPCRRR